MRKLALLFAALLAYAGIAFAAVNINSATKEQLESLNGVGPVKAQAIIDYRAKNGRFKTLEDVKKVDGIGDATFDKIRNDISLTGTTVVPKSDTAPAAKAEQRKAADKIETKAPAPAPKAPAEGRPEPTKAKVDSKADAAKAKVDSKADAPKADSKAEAAKAKADKKAEAAKAKADKKAEAAKAKAEADKAKADAKADAKKKAADKKAEDKKADDKADARKDEKKK